MRDRYLEFIARHEARWELAMAGFAIAFVAIGFLAETPGAPPIYGVIDVALTILFVGEFGSRLAAARDRTRYLRGHWIDAVAIVPIVRGARNLGRLHHAGVLSETEFEAKKAELLLRI
jgi:hypothetical protein